MWRVLLESLRNGVVKASDPAAREAPPARFRGMVMLDPDRCGHTGACVRVCPTNAITLDDDLQTRRTTWEVDHAACVFCGLCESSCPRGAITIGNKFELAVVAKADLRVSVEFALPDATRGR